MGKSIIKLTFKGKPFESWYEKLQKEKNNDSWEKEYLNIPDLEDKVLVSNNPKIDNVGEFYLTREQNDRLLRNGQVVVGKNQHKDLKYKNI